MIGTSKRTSVLHSLKEKSSGKFLAELAASPIHGAVNAMKTLAFGSKSTKKSIKGLRKRVIGKKTITQKEYNRLKAQREAGKQVPNIYRDTTGDGVRVFQADKWRSGGAVGLALDHPVIATGGAVVGGVGAKLMYDNRKRMAGRPKAPPVSTEAWG